MERIIPSILVPDEQTFFRNVQGLGDSVPMIQIDIADGIFVPNKTWADPNKIREKIALDCELHLMVADPIGVFADWHDVPQVKRILVHYESTRNIRDIILVLLSTGYEIGLVLKPETPISVLEPYQKDIRHIMFMGVEPGRQGNPFIPSVLEKIRAYKAQNPTCTIALDGGVSEERLPDILNAGVDIVCPGSAIFGNDRTPKENVEQMQRIILQLTRST